MGSSNNNPDGIRRYEELINDIKKTADAALGIAMSHSIAGASVVLGIEYGGTGSNKKVFVDTYSNQFNINGSKIFHDSCAFQKESDIVDSPELSGNLRLVTCDPQAADIGPQLRLSGRSTDADLTAFAFATIAGRKFNSISGDKAGYLQFATTDAAGSIAEAMRIDYDRNVGIGAIPAIIVAAEQKNRLFLSGGNLLIDYAPRSTNPGDIQAVTFYGREYKIQLGSSSTPDVFSRLQGMENWAVAAPGKHTFLSVNSRFKQDYSCEVDNSDLGRASIELFSDVTVGVINFYTAAANVPACFCPALRGFFHDSGFDVLGDIVATASTQPCGLTTGNVIAGGARNYPDAPLVGPTRGNCDSTKPGMVVGDNLHIGTGDPEGIVCAPIGALYGRFDPDSANDTVYIKTGDNYGPTMWSSVNVGQTNTICMDSGCPDPNKCPTWYDTVNNILWYWEPNAKPGQTLPGAWLSSNVFSVYRNVPGDDGADVVAYRGKTDKKYDYLMPLHFGRNKRHSSGRFDCYFTDLVSSIRVQNNTMDPVKNYYLIDLVTIMARQGTAVSGSAKKEWPGDRDPDDGASWDIKGVGHTYHPWLPTPLVQRSLPTNNVTVRWVGTVTAVNTDKHKLTFDPNQLIGYDINGNVTCGPPGGPCGYTSGMWHPELNRAQTVPPFNDGYILNWLTTASIFNANETRWVTNNGSSYITWRKNMYDAPSIGDTFEVVSSQYRRVLARLSTKGNVWYNAGPYAINDPNYPTRDLNDFVLTGSYATTYQSNDPGGNSPGNSPGPQIPDNYKPQWKDNPFYLQIAMDYYLPLVDDPTSGQTALDAQILALLWDSVQEPGKIAGSICINYKLALPPINGAPC